LSGRGLCDELITRPEESYRLWCVVVCDLETSRIDAPYIYDISCLRVNDLTLILLTWRKWWANNASKQHMGFNSGFKGLKNFTIIQNSSLTCCFCFYPKVITQIVVKNGRRGEERTGEWRKLWNRELKNLHSVWNYIGLIISRRIKCTKSVAHWGETSS